MYDLLASLSGLPYDQTTKILTNVPPEISPGSRAVNRIFVFEITKCSTEPWLLSGLSGKPFALTADCTVLAEMMPGA